MSTCKVLPALLTLLPVMSFAQSVPTTCATQVIAAPVHAPTTNLTTDLGYVAITGNTRVSTMNVAEQIVHTRGYWRFEQLFGAVAGVFPGFLQASFLRVPSRRFSFGVVEPTLVVLPSESPRA